MVWTLDLILKKKKRRSSKEEGEEEKKTIDELAESVSDLIKIDTKPEKKQEKKK